MIKLQTTFLLFEFFILVCVDIWNSLEEEGLAVCREECRENVIFPSLTITILKETSPLHSPPMCSLSHFAPPTLLRKLCSGAAFKLLDQTT